MSRLVKAGGSPGPVIPAPVYDAHLEAARLLEEARDQARAIVHAARAESEALRREAAREGREAGLAMVSELLIAARTERARISAESQAALRTLAVQIAEKILGRELQLSADLVVDVAREALRHAGRPRALELRVNPADLEVLQRGRARLLERCHDSQVLAFRPDERIERGGCVLESELGQVDARLATQLETIARALAGAP